MSTDQVTPGKPTAAAAAIFKNGFPESHDSMQVRADKDSLATHPQ